MREDLARCQNAGKSANVVCVGVENAESAAAVKGLEGCRNADPHAYALVKGIARRLGGVGREPEAFKVGGHKALAAVGNARGLV